MRIDYSATFRRGFKSLPDKIKKKFEKQIHFLTRNLRHPSLKAKKYEKIRSIWQARVDDNYRFYFLISNDTYILLDIKKHPK
mgnify:CR=1 FL=1